MRTPVGLIVFVVLVVPVMLSGSGIHYLPDFGAGMRLMFGLFLASPIFGIGFLVYRFFKWHAAFHQRMRDPRR